MLAATAVEIWWVCVCGKPVYRPEVGTGREKQRAWDKHKKVCVSVRPRIHLVNVRFATAR